MNLTRHLFPGFFLMLLLPMQLLSQEPGTKAAIHNDFYWTDENGNRIQTRSGCLVKFGETYYWYGGSRRFRDQNCYSSTDLVHWKHLGVVLTHPTDANRIDVLYNSKTRQYVMFLKYDGNGAHFAIATADKPEGPFTFKEQMLIDEALIGDMSIFQDDDGTAYLCYVSWAKGTNAQHGIYKLSEDYLKPEKRIHLWDTGGREAPHMMKHDGLYYYGTSKTAWIDASGTNYYTATKIDGPWSEPIEMKTPGSNNTWDTQCDFVFPIRGTKGTVYLYVGDRWLKDRNNGRDGDYVWLPVEFDGKTPVLNYYQDWEIDPVAGTWEVIDPKRNLAQGKKVSASSEFETSVATHVTAAKTYHDFVNYRWESQASDPQWIAVDLGEPTEINRVILKWGSLAAKRYAIEVSIDGKNWSEVFASQLGFSLGVTDAKFAITKAQHVRVMCLERAAQPPSPGRRVISASPGSTRPITVPSTQATQPSRPQGYSIFDFQVLRD